MGQYLTDAVCTDFSASKHISTTVCIGKYTTFKLIQGITNTAETKPNKYKEF